MRENKFNTPKTDKNGLLQSNVAFTNKILDLISDKALILSSKQLTNANNSLTLQPKLEL